MTNKFQVRLRNSWQMQVLFVSLV